MKCARCQRVGCLVFIRVHAYTAPYYMGKVDNSSSVTLKSDGRGRPSTYVIQSALLFGC